MGRIVSIWAGLAIIVLAGCNEGYVSKAELESGAHGPAQCWKSCHELGMEMSALVLIEHARAGCVCAVRGTQASSRAASAAAAAEVVIQEDEAAADNANRTAMHPYTPH